MLQFSGKITLEYFNQVEEILKVITNAEYANEWNNDIEFRNALWYMGETFELLVEYNTCMVLHDFSKVKSWVVNDKTDLVYVRFHGPTGNYKSSYSHEFLNQKTVQIKYWLSNGNDVYAYFNDTAGDAYQNAITLKDLYNIS